MQMSVTETDPLRLQLAKIYAKAETTVESSGTFRCQHCSQISKDL